MKLLFNFKVLCGLSILLFGSSFLIGYLMGEYTSIVKNQEELIIHTPGLELTLDLFTNNITICLLLLLGIVTFGIPTLFYLLLNGFVLGIGVNDLISIGIPLNEFFMKLLPHAILEIPAFILSGAIGLYGFTFYLGYRIQIRPFLNYTIIIITMISLAAFIEGYISTSF